MKDKHNHEVFTYGQRKTSFIGLKGPVTQVNPAVEIQIWKQANSWHWSLTALTRARCFYISSAALSECLPSRFKATLLACNALILYSRNQGKIPKGWESWMFSTFGDASQQLALFDYQEPQQLRLF